MSVVADAVTISKDELKALVADAVAQARTGNDMLADATGKAPLVAKHNTPRAFAGREERSDEHAASQRGGKRGLLSARYAMAMVRRNDVARNGGHLTVAEAADSLGYRSAAEKFNLIGGGDAAAGGSLVPVDVQLDYIDSLEAFSNIRGLIPAQNRIQSQREAIAFPVVTGGVTAAWLGRNSAPTNSSITTGSLMLRARKYSAECLIERAWLREAVGNPDQLVRSKLALRGAQLEDLAILEGQGTEYQPKGLASWAGNTAAATATPAYLDVKKDLLGSLKRISLDNVDMSAGRCFIGHEQMKWGLCEFENSAGTEFPFEKELQAGRLLGHPAAFSNVSGVSTSHFFCVAPAEMLLFDHLGLTFEEDNTYVSSSTTYSASANDQVVIRVWREMDFALMHANACDVLTSVTWGA